MCLKSNIIWLHDLWLGIWEWANDLFSWQIIGHVFIVESVGDVSHQSSKSEDSWSEDRMYSWLDSSTAKATSGKSLSNKSCKNACLFVSYGSLGSWLNAHLSRIAYPRWLCSGLWSFGDLKWWWPKGLRFGNFLLSSYCSIGCYNSHKVMLPE